MERSGGSTCSCLHLFAKKRGDMRREKLPLRDSGRAPVKWWNFTSVNILSPPLDISQSFILGRSYSNLSGLGPPFSDLMKSGAPGERGLAITAQQQGRTYLVRTAGISVICFFFCVGTLIDLCIFDGTDIGVWQIFFLTLTLSSLTSSPRSSFHALNPRPSDYDLTQHQISETA